MTNSSSSTATTQTTPSTISSLQSIHVHHLISVKLDTSNYLIWLTQFKPLLKGYDLEGYVDGTLECPPRILTAASAENAASATINPEYVAWQKQDQILLGWLLSSLSETVLAQVVGLSTSRDVWLALEKHYSSKSKSRVLHLRRELHNLKKGSKTMQQYFLHAKQIADNLAASGNPLSDLDLQYTVLTGLDSAYDSVVTSLLATISNMSMDDFYAHLLTFELRLEDQNSIMHSSPVANVAQRNGSNSRSGFNNNNYGNTQGRQYFRGSSSRSSSNNHRGNNNRSSNSRPQPGSNAEGPCQLCGRKNHVVANCWHRFDKAFYPHASSPRAFIAAPGSLTDSNWVPDSGASHHLTSDLSNLNIHSSYDGPDQIRVGNAHKKAICVMTKPPRGYLFLAMSDLKNPSFHTRPCRTVLSPSLLIVFPM
ncbi:hypothetical protein ACHQM5_022856 [Ranunculus cassubicifolius]